MQRWMVMGMREILFRGKRIDGLWVEGHGITVDESETRILSDLGDSYGLTWCRVYPETVGQFTGLTDKNGKKIFEGDILRYGLIYDYECYLESLEHPECYDGEVHNMDIETDAVMWCIGYNYPAFDLRNHQFECNGISQIMCGDYEYEVIGNIHDNPELIGGKGNA